MSSPAEKAQAVLCTLFPQGHLEKADKSEKWKWLGSLLPLLSAFGFSDTCPASTSAPLPTPRPLAKSQGFEEVSRSLATSPVRPQEPDSSSQAVGWHLERCLPAGTPPLPTSSPPSALSGAVSLSIPPPGLVLPPVPLALPPFAFILLSPPLQPPLSSPSPLLSSPLPPAPPLGSPSRRAAPP